MKYIIGLLTAGLLLFGCSDEHSDHNEDTHEMHDHDDDHSGHDHGEGGHIIAGKDDHQATDGITLNNGEKWEADKHTNDKVSEMKTEIADYKKSNDYATLSTNLKADLSDLIEGCTMGGEPHNQLHHWLEPYIGYVNNMKDANNDADKSANVERIESSLIQYTEYFK